ncbi:MAG: hypothetical protein ACYDBJ_19160 [Aggregatilineales bacterium]
MLAFVLRMVWQATVPANAPTTLLLPRPSAIGQRLIEIARDGTLLGDAFTTALASVSVFALAAFALGLYSVVSWLEHRLLAGWPTASV